MGGVAAVTHRYMKGWCRFVDITITRRSTLFGEDPSVPVSYTHLDVYKRQLITGLPASLFLCGLYFKAAVGNMSADIGIK